MFISKPVSYAVVKEAKKRSSLEQECSELKSNIEDLNLDITNWSVKHRKLQRCFENVSVKNHDLLSKILKENVFFFFKQVCVKPQAPTYGVSKHHQEKSFVASLIFVAGAKLKH